MPKFVIRSLVDLSKNLVEDKFAGGSWTFPGQIDPDSLYDIDIDLVKEDVSDAQSLLSLLNSLAGFQERWSSLRLILRNMEGAKYIFGGLPSLKYLIIETVDDGPSKDPLAFILNLSASTQLETLCIKANVWTGEMPLPPTMLCLKELELTSKASSSPFPSVGLCLNVLERAPNLQTIKLFPCSSPSDSNLPNVNFVLENVSHAEFSSRDSSFEILEPLLLRITLPGLTELSINVYNDAELDDITRRAQSVRRYRWIRSLLARSGAFEKIKTITITSEEEEEEREGLERNEENGMQDRSERGYEDKRGLLPLLLELKSIQHIEITSCNSLTRRFFDTIKSNPDSFQKLETITFTNCTFGYLHDGKVNEEVLEDAGCAYNAMMESRREKPSKLTVNFRNCDLTKPEIEVTHTSNDGALFLEGNDLMMEE